MIYGDACTNIKKNKSKDLQKDTMCISSSIFEEYFDVNDAIAREKQLKHWVRAKKNWLVETKNPNWEDWGKFFI